MSPSDVHPIKDHVEFRRGLDVTPIHCRIIPGHFILRCYRREIQFLWIPPSHEPIKKAMVKYKQHQAAQFNTMSGHGWGRSGVQLRNHTLSNLWPNTVYEFGLNVIFENQTFAQFPSPSSEQDMCACKTHADVPSMPENLQYHYLHDNRYSLEWDPGADNGEPIEDYDLKALPQSESLPMGPETNWRQLTLTNLTENQASFTLDTREQTMLQLRAVNKVGPSRPAYLAVRPPLKTLTDDSHGSKPIFGPLHHMSNVVAYSLLSAGIVFFLLLLLALIIYKKRRASGKVAKHPFLISFNPSKRLHSGSGNDSFGLGGGASDLTTSGIPVDLSTLEPLWNQEVNSLYGMGKSDVLSFEQVTQVPAANIRFHRYIGCGAFGKVWEGWLHVTDIDGDRFEKVALKVRNIKSLSEAEFRREATLMHRYQHANIVRFFGVSFDSPTQQCLVLEMMDQGNLRDYLHRARPRIAPDVAANMFAAAAICAAGGPAITDARTAVGSENSSMNTGTTGTAAAAGGGSSSNCGMTAASGVITLTAQLDLPALMCIMRDIANGCRYLEEQHFVHRDIAARNCLVSHNHPTGRIVKLCDFGLARDIYKNDCYRKRNEPKLPVRWMSPEAIRDGLFTTKSDVWAFSVTCWEVMTLGADPFYGRANLDVMNLVIGGHVLGRPENCPEELYNQMLQCWSRFTEMRPSFADLVKKMNEFVQASHNEESPFSGPFLVTLPLPKSLPDSNGQPFFACTSTENPPRLTTNNSDSSQRRCQRRASLNEPPRANQIQLQNRMHQSVYNCHMNELDNPLLPPPVWSPQQQDCARGYLIGPLNSASETHSHNIHHRQADSHPSYLIPSTVTTTTTQESNLHSNGISATSFVGNPIDGPILAGHHSRSFSNSDCMNRPNSLFENSTLVTGNQEQYEAHPVFYRTLSHRSSQKPESLNSLTRSLLVHVNDHNLRSDQGHMSADLTAGPNGAINYGLLETGGGLDSLGYQRPSWKSRSIIASPQMTLQFPSTEENTASRCPGCQPNFNPSSLNH